MPLQTQSDVKYASSELLAETTEWDTLRVEHRQVPGGAYNPITSSFVLKSTLATLSSMALTISSFS